MTALKRSRFFQSSLSLGGMSSCGARARKAARSARAFSRAVTALREDGTYDEISTEWFGLDVYGG